MEIWKDIFGYEGIYMASSLGRIKSLMFGKEKILKPGINSTGYYVAILSKNKKRKTFKVHQLIAMAFLNHVPDKYKMVIDHVNSIPTDNRIENLRVVSNRFNLSKDRKNKTSKYTGVYKHSGSEKWISQAVIGKKRIYLGIFDNEYDAHIAYTDYVGII
jgi:hypothetical protein